LDAAAWASNGKAGPHDALIGVALAARNSHQDKSASAMTDYQAELLTAIVSSNFAKECVGSNRLLKRTIATSRSDDNRDESRRTDRDNHTQNSPCSPANKKRPFRPSLPLRKNPMENRFQLDRLFQERSATRLRVFLGAA
jgi:hypothetical protein